jgi:LuxR family transcriptional regulator, maltose regulon positive regulatory protein
MECEGREHCLLATKLAIPPTYRKNVVPRPRLYGQLAAGIERPLTLIMAPAGFGKTTLVGEWLRQCHLPVAWMSLEKGDNDLARFWCYIIQALHSLSESTGYQFELLPPYPSEYFDVEATLTTLINLLMTLPQDIILALDDYQTITEPAIHQSLQFLLEHQPPQLHLLITTRTSFLLPIARLRVQGKLTEMRAADLRFTAEETECFLTQAMGLPLSRADIVIINERTEGWAAGLQLAALSLQGSDDPTTISKIVAAFSGQQRSVLHYLTDEILAYQSTTVQDFLLATSVLERMNADLCNAVTGQTNGQMMLEQLDAANLLLPIIDKQEKWYRYYHLFADLLRYRLKHTYPELEPELHRRACAWYEQHGMIVEAVTHTLAVSAMERTAESCTTSHHAQARQAPQLNALSERERTVLRLIAEGLSNQAIADTLVVTVSTVKTHLNNIYAKLHVHTRLQAVTRAYDLGLLSRGETESDRLNHSASANQR